MTLAAVSKAEREKSLEERWPGDSDVNGIPKEIAALTPQAFGCIPGSTAQEVTGYTAGVFDMLHVGHLRLLQQARAQCDRLVVGVTTDELCQRRKHKTPVIPYADRAAMLLGLRCVDEVVPQHHMDRIAAWEQLRFGVTFVGDDWKGTDSWTAYESQFARLGVRVVYFPYTGGVSSTLLRERLRQVPAAA